MFEHLDRLPYPLEFATPRDLPLNPYTAVTPTDGRYADNTAIFRPYVSEWALLRGQIMVNVKHLQQLSREEIIRPITEMESQALDGIWIDFSMEDVDQIKVTEKRVRHIVKSMEYYMKDKLKGTSLDDIVEKVRLGITSEDDTNLARNLGLAIVKDTILVPTAWNLVDAVDQQAMNWLEKPMVGRTHQRRAVPTTVAKQVELFARRMAIHTRKLQDIRLSGKLSGAVGDYNEFVAARPDYDWLSYSERLVTSLGLAHDPFTTQSQDYENLIDYLTIVYRFNTVVRSVDDNLRGYISHDYFTLPPKEDQSGSSIMPQKGRNPELYDRSDGSAAVSDWMIEGMTRELLNRLYQREFDDSTIVRYVGQVLATSYMSWQFLREDFSDTLLNTKGLQSDLNNRWEMVTAGLQTRMRLIGVPRPYEIFDGMAKKGGITKAKIVNLVLNLDLPDDEKSYLLGITPTNFVGKAEKLALQMHEEIQHLKQPSL